MSVLFWTFWNQNLGLFTGLNIHLKESKFVNFSSLHTNKANILSALHVLTNLVTDNLDGISVIPAVLY